VGQTISVIPLKLMTEPLTSSVATDELSLSIADLTMHSKAAIGPSKITAKASQIEEVIQVNSSSDESDIDIVIGPRSKRRSGIIKFRITSPKHTNVVSEKNISVIADLNRLVNAFPNISANHSRNPNLIVRDHHILPTYLDDNEDLDEIDIGCMERQKMEQEDISHRCVYCFKKFKYIEGMNHHISTIHSR
jgi:hypothetical protein